MVRVTSRVTLFSLLIASSSGCLGNVNYVPRDDDRLRLGIRGGRFLYVRDGLAIGGGAGGGGCCGVVFFSGGGGAPRGRGPCHPRRSPAPAPNQPSPIANPSR